MLQQMLIVLVDGNINVDPKITGHWQVLYPVFSRIDNTTILLFSLYSSTINIILLWVDQIIYLYNAKDLVKSTSPASKAHTDVVILSLINISLKQIITGPN